MANHYDPPSWAGKPPTGLHLDVLKGDRLVQKLMLDQKKCYLFGRNQEMCDFSIDHQSCSRVHAAFVYHKHLNRGFLVDLGSTHGTFIGKLRIEAHKPTFLPVDSQFHFGHSTRVYVLRARPQIPNIPILEEFENEDEHADDSIKLENEIALDNITEYNTAQNRRITVAGMDRTDFPRPDLKRKKHSVTFNDEEEIINPEDIDPTVGRFRNLVSTTVIPAKRHKAFADETTNYMLKKDHPAKGAPFPVSYHHDLYYDIPSVHFNDENHSQKVDDAFNSYSSSIVAKLGLPLPNPAPDVDLVENYTPVEDTPMSTKMDILPKKKKYAKEAWPGKKPSTSSMLV